SIRPQHRRARKPSAADAPRRRARAADHQDRVRARLSRRRAGRARAVMRLVPASLFGRLLTALLLAIGVALLIVVALLLSERRDSLFVGSEAAAIVNAIDTTVASLTKLSPDEREAEIEKLRREPPTVERPAPRQLRNPGAETAESVRELQSRLARALGS